MLPIGPLMWEHRLIELVILPMKKELSRMNETKKVDFKLVDTIVDFIRTYADRCHHGKEEGILFRDLAKKRVPDEHAKIMRELIEEHVYARITTSNLEKAKVSYLNGNPESLKDVRKLLNDLAEFYPRHIEKEDKKFFYPSMGYFTQQEHEAMLREFWDFDRKLIHEKYAKVLDEIERITLG